MSRRRRGQRSEPPPPKHYVSNLYLPTSTIANVRNKLARLKSEAVLQDYYLFDEGSDNRPDILEPEISYLESIRIALMDKEKCAPRNIDLINERLFFELANIRSNPKYDQMKKLRQKLPAFKQRREILYSIKQHQVVLITGDTGCGKTTQVPQFVLDEWLENRKGGECRIICTQPRRIAAISMAERVASERAESLGESVGYQIRLENNFPRADGGSILFVTTGILLKLLESDPILQGFSHVILDEIHERTVETDIILGILKILINYRRDIRVILMSATLRADQFSEYFDHCPIIHIEGNTYPVTELFLEDVIEEIGFKEFETLDHQEPEMNLTPAERAENEKWRTEFQAISAALSNNLTGKYRRETIKSVLNPISEEINLDLISSLIFHINSTKPEGAILVFLTGFDTISKLNELLKKDRSSSNAARLEVFPLHSMMPTINQKEIFQPSPPGHRKVVISTNIAETSITINDVVYVINCGKHKIKKISVAENIAILSEEWISLANAMQRKGRAGRTRAGTCYHLYSSARSKALEEYPLPQIEREMEESTILSIKMLRLGHAESFFRTLLTAPKLEVVEARVVLLKRLGALNEDESLTALGCHLARLPLDPNTAKMILFGAIFNCVDPITTVAANLTFKVAFVKPLGKDKEVNLIRNALSKGCCSDHLMLVNVMADWRKSKKKHAFCQEHFLDSFTLFQLEGMKKDFCASLYAMKFLTDRDPESAENNRNSADKHLNLLSSVICAGLYPNIACLEIRQRPYRGPFVNVFTPDDGWVRIHPVSVNFDEKYFKSTLLCYYDKMQTTNKFLYDTTMIQPLALIFFGDRVYKNGNRIDVADFCFFECGGDTAELVMELRGILHRLLNKKILHPSPTDWKSTEGKLLRLFVNILSSNVHEEATFDSD